MSVVSIPWLSGIWASIVSFAGLVARFFARSGAYLLPFLLAGLRWFWTFIVRRNLFAIVLLGVFITTIFGLLTDVVQFLGTKVISFALPDSIKAAASQVGTIFWTNGFCFRDLADHALDVFVTYALCYAVVWRFSMGVAASKLKIGRWS